MSIDSVWLKESAIFLEDGEHYTSSGELEKNETCSHRDRKRSSQAFFSIFFPFQLSGGDGLLVGIEIL